MIHGVPLIPATSYTITVNSFMASGGDKYTVLKSGTNRVIGPVDLDVLITKIGAMPQPFNAMIEGRLQKTPWPWHLDLSRRA